jgi:alanine racemase
MPLNNAWATIDHAALLHNVSRVSELAPNSSIMAVIKSLAYGHGAVSLAYALQRRVDAFAVARVEEGLALRAEGITKSILVLEGLCSPEQLSLAQQHQLDVAIHHPKQLEWLDTLDGPLGCWIKVDSGMSRLGLHPDQVPEVLAAVQQHKYLKLKGAMTHLANADDPQDSKTDVQLAAFNGIAWPDDLALSIANSAAVLTRPDAHADWVRPGLMLYGASPLLNQSAQSLGLKPVMQLSSRLISIKQLNAGDTVGYGATWQADESMPMGVVGIGYGDGYPREVPAEAYVLINGKQAPIIGRVSMDMITVDLRGIDGLIGDEVTLWGEGLPIDLVAKWTNTIAYTLMCGVTQRVQRINKS